MLTRLRQSLGAAHRHLMLPPAAKAEMRIDRKGLPECDPGNAAVLGAALAWMKTAQDNSRSNDGGLARCYSLIDGWSSSYPETTGYIIPTLLKHAAGQRGADARGRVFKMLDWLVSIQLPGGGFQGGRIDDRPVVPVTFNTGSVLLGLAAAAAAFGAAYRAPMTRAAEWLQATQDDDGCWRKYPSPFAKAGEKVQDVHAAWGLLEAGRVAPDRGYADAALKNVRWAISHQTPDGWFSKTGAPDRQPVVSHTLGFVLRGLLEAYGYSEEKEIWTAARKTADGLLQALRLKDGFLPGLIDSRWSAAADWNCLVGSAQIACCWWIMYKHTSDEKYRRAASAVNRNLRRSVKINAAQQEMTGAIKGAFPVHGGYMPFSFISPKFLIDAIALENEV